MPVYPSVFKEDKCLCFGVLAQGNWPLLGTLELHGVEMTQECIELLGTGDWELVKFAETGTSQC